MGHDNKIDKRLVIAVIAGTLITGSGHSVIHLFEGNPIVAEASTTKSGTTTEALNLRTGAGTNHRIIKTLKKGEKVTILSTSSGWLKVKVGSQEGWVSANYVKVGATSSTNTASKSTETKNGTTTVALNLRKGAGTNHGIIKTLKKGEKVVILSTKGGWFKVKAGSQEGWVSTKYVKAGSTSPTTTSSKTTSSSSSTKTTETQNGATTVALNLRKGAGTNHGIIKTLKKGEKVTILSSNNGWLKVKAGSQEGWVSAQYVKVGSTSSTTPSSPTSSKAIEVKSGTTTDALNLRKGAGTSYGVLRVLPKGTTVNILSTSGDWLKVKAGSQEGWVSKKYIKTGATTTASSTGFYRNIKTVTNPNSFLVLVDKNNQLNKNYVPNDLVLPNVLDSTNNPNRAQYMRKEAANQVEKLFSAANKEKGLVLLARSGYRSYATQDQLYKRYVANYGQTQADTFSARPGHSEHQTGLALDVTANSVKGELVATFGTTKEGIWLKENAHRFGFIISYPKGKDAQTGYTYEPWHIRYVGIEPATEMYKKGLLLDSYLRK